jgi:hypothetical protein
MKLSSSTSLAHRQLVRFAQHFYCSNDKTEVSSYRQYSNGDVELEVVHCSGRLSLYDSVAWTNDILGVLDEHGESALCW